MTNFFHVFIFHKKYPISSRISTSSFDEQDVLWIRLCISCFSQFYNSSMLSSAIVEISDSPMLYKSTLFEKSCHNENKVVVCLACVISSICFFFSIFCNSHRASFFLDVLTPKLICGFIGF